MTKTLILQPDDIKVSECGFNAFIAKGDLEIIINYEAVPILLDQLSSWLSEQDIEEREAYLRAKFE